MRRRLGSLVAAVAIGGLATAARPGPATAAATVFRCINEESGARWTLHVDFDHGTVDGYKASVGAREISWHDTQDQGFYSLDQATGDLKMVRASSMGGWEQHAVCHPG